MYLRINAPNVVRECFDGEVVLVNLERGTYYSLENLSAKIWLLFEKGHSLIEVVDVLEKRFKVGTDQIRQSVERFVESLSNELLIVKEEQPVTCETDAGTLDLWSDAPEAFIEPSIRKYSDMQDLLLLDPIHDVDQAGWPSAGQMPKPAHES